MEHKYSFDDQDIDRYAEKIQSKFDAKVGRREAEKKAHEEIDGGADIDFLEQADEDNQGAANVDMEGVNLFGVPLSELDSLDLDGGEESLKERNTRR